MRRAYLTMILLSMVSQAFSQEKLFSIGYGKTYVASDSSTLNITFDLNRIPGQNEKAGGYYFVNEVLGVSRWRYFLKPMMDVNIGSAVASSPNNIAVGLPFGLAYDVEGTNLSLYLEGSPDLIANKEFNQKLYYFNVTTYLKYEILTKKGFLLNIITGISNANGIRDHTGIHGTSNYGRITIPVYLKTVFWKDTSKSGKEFNRFNWTNSFKYNHIYEDNSLLNPKRDYTFFNSKLDFYITPNIGLNITYFKGNEEPVFKHNNSLTFGFSIAR